MGTKIDIKDMSVPMRDACKRLVTLQLRDFVRRKHFTKPTGKKRVDPNKINQDTITLEDFLPEEKWDRNIKEYAESEPETNAPRDPTHNYDARVNALQRLFKMQTKIIRESLGNLSTEERRSFCDIAAQLREVWWEWLERSGIEMEEPMQYFDGNTIDDEPFGKFGIFEAIAAIGKISKGDHLPQEQDELVMKAQSMQFNFYGPEMKPDSRSSVLARFRRDALSLAHAAPGAHRRIAQARLEITSNMLFSPYRMAVSSKRLVITGGTGWKQRDPSMMVWRLDKMSGKDWMNDYGYKYHEPGFPDHIESVTIDDTRDLIWATDGQRIKSYRGKETKGGEGEAYVNTHTFRIDDKGPFALLNDGAKLVMAGKNSLSFWDVDSSPTHQSVDGGILGEEMDPERVHIWRDEFDEIELLTGIPRSSSLSLNIHTPVNFLEKSRRVIPGSDSLLCGFGKGSVDVFTAGSRTECIKCHDIRNRKVLYELSIGNNKPVALAWDQNTSTLFAATDCYYMSRMGSVFPDDVRPIEIRRPKKPATNDEKDKKPDSNDENDWEDEDSEDDDEDEEDEYEYGSDDGYWPERAVNNEDSFGYPYNAGDHALLRYHFTDEPDLKVKPESGEISVASEFGFKTESLRGWDLK
ncbi:hypothetical protein RUND412_002559 [Rhizina undulata]